MRKCKCVRTCKAPPHSVASSLRVNYVCNLIHNISLLACNEARAAINTALFAQTGLSPTARLPSIKSLTKAAPFTAEQSDDMSVPDTSGGNGLLSLTAFAGPGLCLARKHCRSPFLVVNFHSLTILLWFSLFHFLPLFLNI